MGDDVQVRHVLCVLGEYLEEAGVVDTVVIVVPRMHVEARLGHRPAADVQHVRQALAHGRVQRFVHVGDTLPGREIGRAQSGHRHSRRHRRRGMLAFGLDEDQRPPGDVDVPACGCLGPVLAHLRGRCNRIRTSAVGRFTLAHNGGGITVHRRTYAGILAGLLGFFHRGKYSLRLGQRAVHFGALLAALHGL